jgi:hypothetical protein
METFLLDFLTKPMLLDIDVLETGLKPRSVLRQESDSLLIITKDRRTVSSAEVDVLKESLPAVELLGGMGKREKLSFSA